jgi:hypothetical protein
MIVRHKKYDMADFVKDKIFTAKKWGLASDRRSGYVKAYGLLEKLFAMKLVMAEDINPAVLVQLDSSMENHSMAEYLIEFINNFGGYLINNGSLISSYSEFSEGTLIVVLNG